MSISPLFAAVKSSDLKALLHEANPSACSQPGGEGRHARQGLIFDARQSTAGIHAERADSRGIRRLTGAQVVADVPDGAIITRVDGSLSVVFPSKRIGLRSFPFN